MILLALTAGIVMVCAAIVIDLGTMSLVRAEEQNACDSGALAGITEAVYSGSAAQGMAKARAVLADMGYVVGRRGVTSIDLTPYNSVTGAFSETDCDRFTCTMQRSLPQFFVGALGITSTWVRLAATAARFGAVPADISLGNTAIAPRYGFPIDAWLNVYGPEAHYIFGDCYSTREDQNQLPNPLYDPRGYPFEMVVPSDYASISGSNRVRVEIFDADCWNRSGANPFPLSDTDGDGSEPETGNVDTLKSNLDTQTEWRIVDAAGTVVASAVYGPSSCSPFWFQRQLPGTDAINTIGSLPGGQSAIDLKWITPQGFCFDPTPYQAPIRVYVRSLSGDSANGYTMRIGADRASGQVFSPVRDTVSPTSALGMFANGRLCMGFNAPRSETAIPIGDISPATTKLTITNFDADVGVQNCEASMTSFDSTQGRRYPVLFPAPNAGRHDDFVVTDQAGNQYYTKIPVNLSGNTSFATTVLTVPQPVKVPSVDADGNLLLDRNGRIIINDTRAYQGGELAIDYYLANKTDVSTWTVNSNDTASENLSIVLIR
ncbi:MAG: Tad domain-containing protein [Armatimonadetes bacterium]|nr:Tad domain-containing protein [Armatimonadota bacterium]